MWGQTPYADLSMNQVAKEAQLAKGTLYLYFDTKEEMFLQLLSEHLHSWLAELQARLDEAPPQTPLEVAAHVIEVSCAYAPLRRLLLLLPHLERVGRAGTEQDFRRELRRPLLQLLGSFPCSPRLGVQILLHAYALAIGWQQVAEERQNQAAQLWGAEYTVPDFRSGFEPALLAAVAQLTAQEGGDALGQPS